jgi:2-dehydropantoate 2-reductase
MRWKYGKLLLNLGNAVEAAFGPAARRGELTARVRAEAEAVLRRAGIDWVGEEEDGARRAGVVQPGRIGGRERGGGSSWQSLARGAGSIEVDDLNGEIVLLGRLHGAPAPLNEALQRLVRRMAAEGAPPGSADPAELARATGAAPSA